MIRICAVEDEMLHQNRIDAIVETFRLTNHSVRPLECFDRVAEFKDYFDAVHTYDLYFLDVDIDGDREGGIQLAKHIRTIDSYGDIVFITSHSNMMPLAFESHVKAYDFIAKDLPEKDFRNKITESLSHALEMHGVNTCRRVKKPDELFNYHYRQRRGVQLPYDQILYIQNTEESHRLLLMGQQGSMQFYGSLNDILDKDTAHHFIRISRSLLINPLAVDHIDRKRKVMVFNNNIEQEISRRHMTQISEKIQYIKNRL